MPNPSPDETRALDKRTANAIEDALADIQDVLDYIRPFAKPEFVRKWDRAVNLLDQFVLDKRHAD